MIAVVVFVAYTYTTRAYEPHANLITMTSAGIFCLTSRLYFRISLQHTQHIHVFNVAPSLFRMTLVQRVAHQFLLLCHFHQKNDKLTTVNLPWVVNIGEDFTLMVMRTCMFTSIYMCIYAGSH
jgi:hypothetical protein